MYLKIMRFISIFLLTGIALSFLAILSPSSLPLVVAGSIVLLVISVGYLIFLFAKKYI